MIKTICENSLFNILFFRKHRELFLRHNKLFPCPTNNTTNTYHWVKQQSHQIDLMGFDKWYITTTGPFGPDESINIRPKSTTFKYVIKLPQK